MNLLTETRDDMESVGLKHEDIIFIGSESSGYSCTWKEFEVLADFNYNNSYGGQEVASDLIIVFKDGSEMERMEYDGYEWWGIRRLFKMPEVRKPILSLKSEGYGTTLEGIQEDLES